MVAAAQAWADGKRVTDAPLSLRLLIIARLGKGGFTVDLLGQDLDLWRELECYAAAEAAASQRQASRDRRASRRRPGKRR